MSRGRAAHGSVDIRVDDRHIDIGATLATVGAIRSLGSPTSRQRPPDTTAGPRPDQSVITFPSSSTSGNRPPRTSFVAASSMPAPTKYLAVPILMVVGWFVAVAAWISIAAGSPETVRDAWRRTVSQASVWVCLGAVIVAAVPLLLLAAVAAWAAAANLGQIATARGIQVVKVRPEVGEECDLWVSRSTRSSEMWNHP